MSTAAPHPAAHLPPRTAIALVALGLLVNALAQTAPGATPLLMGNAAAYALALRQRVSWAMLSALLLGAVAGGPAWALLSVVATVLCWWRAKQSAPRLMQMALPMAAYLLWPAALLLDGAPLRDALSAAAVLITGHVAAGLAAQKLQALDLPADERARTGLSEQMAARLGLGTALPLSLLLLAIGQFWWLNRAADETGQVDESVRDLGVTVQRFLDARLAAVAFAADSSALPAQPPDLPALMQRFPGFISLLVTDSAGQVVGFHAPGLSPFAGSVADRPYFREPRDSGQPFLSGAFQGRGFGSDMLVAMSAPHRDAAGRFAGVVQASVSLKTLSERLRREAEGHRTDFVLVDPDGQLLASSLGLDEGAAVGESWLSAPQRRHGLLLDGAGDWLVADADVELAGWRVRTLRPFAPLRWTADWHNVGIALSCITLLVLMSRLVGRFLTPELAPISGLIGRMRGIDLSRPATLLEPDQPASSREYSALRDEFGAMLARISELYGALQQAAIDSDRINRELEQRVAERTAALREALQRAERLANAKTVFLANMSHELRTPLSAILGHAEGALSRTGSPQAMEDALRVIDRNGRHLQGILNDILDASRLDAGQLPLERVAVAPLALAEDVRGLFAEKARELGLAFGLQAKWPLPATIVADPLRLRQVLLNLVGNALKFTQHGEVWIELAAPDRQTLTISIVDTGIGMDAATSARLFGAFEQADASTTRRFGGTGLGLYISRALVLRMGGQISVESTPGIGSRFRVSLPISDGTPWLDGPDEAPQAAPSTPRRPPRLSGRVMVAEDVDDLRTLIAGIVNETGAQTLMAANGASAVTLTQFEGADMVLLDMHMPVMDGAEAARRLREEGYDKPIIAVTADVLPEDVERYLAAGCTQVLPKPIDRQRLWNVLAQHLPSALPPTTAPLRSAAGAQAATVAPRATGAAPATDPMAALMRKTRGRFAEALRDELAAIRHNDPAQDGGDLRRRLHMLKGSAGTFGFPALGSAAATAEASLRSGAVDWPAQRDALLAAIDEAIATVAAEAAEAP